MAQVKWDVMTVAEKVAKLTSLPQAAGKAAFVVVSDADGNHVPTFHPTKAAAFKKATWSDWKAYSAQEEVVVEYITADGEYTHFTPDIVTPRSEKGAGRKAITLD